MRRSITAVSLVVVGLAAVACGGSGKGGSSSVSSTTPAPPVATVPAATTTTEEPPSSAAPTTTTTTLITDATTADPKALAAQLQAVLDRYHELFVASRTDPLRPFTDQQLADDFRKVADNGAMEALIRAWWQFRDADSAVRVGPSGMTRRYLTTVQAADATTVAAIYCLYDDAVTFKMSDGSVLDDSTVVAHSAVTFIGEGGSWRIDHVDSNDDAIVPSASPNPCPAEQNS